MAGSRVNQLRLKMAAAMFKSFFPFRSFAVFLRSPLLCAKKKIEVIKLQENGIEEPKAPGRPFFLFLSEKMDHIKKQDPKLSPTGRVKKVQDLWKELSETEKKKYFSLYKTLYEKYLDDMYLYYQEINKLPNEVSSSVPMKKSLLKVWKTKLGKPTCPPRAFLKFAMDHAQKSGKPFKVPHSVNEGMEKWKLLPESERDKYLKQAKIEWMKYDKELLQWEKKMVEDGHHLLVRAKSLKLAKKLTAID